MQNVSNDTKPDFVQNVAEDPSSSSVRQVFLIRRRFRGHGPWVHGTRDYEFKVADTRTASAAASSTPRKIIGNKIMIYARVPGKRTARNRSAILPVPLPVLSLRSFVVQVSYMVLFVRVASPIF